MVPKIGIVFRSYAKTPELVPEVVERAITSIKKAKSITFFNEPCFETVYIIVPADYDCGLTALAIEERLEKENISRGVYIEETKGHHSCYALNDALWYVRNHGMRYALIISHKAIAYLTKETMWKVIYALSQGFRVVGVRIKELNDVQESPIQNTFAVWDIKEMEKFSAGEYYRGFVTLFETELGVEEVAPLIRLQKLYGKCAAVINAEGSLNIRESEDGKARHKEVRDTKRALQEQEAARLGVTLDFVKENIVEL